MKDRDFMRRDVLRAVLPMLLAAVVLLNACGVSPQATPTFAPMTPTVAPSPSPTVCFCHDTDGTHRSLSGAPRWRADGGWGRRVLRPGDR
ncbi:MAG: hypothetical protein ABFD44_14315 [Anaerolineaceae bacterium]